LSLRQTCIPAYQQDTASLDGHFRPGKKVNGEIKPLHSPILADPAMDTTSTVIYGALNEYYSHEYSDRAFETRDSTCCAPYCRKATLCKTSSLSCRTACPGYCIATTRTYRYKGHKHSPTNLHDVCPASAHPAPPPFGIGRWLTGRWHVLLRKLCLNEYYTALSYPHVRPVPWTRSCAVHIEIGVVRKLRLKLHQHL
jgi:hypothetical protein